MFSRACRRIGRVRLVNYCRITENRFNYARRDARTDTFDGLFPRKADAVAFGEAKRAALAGNLKRRQEGLLRQLLELQKYE
ncbi:hypothetical protein ALP82_03275 [Pseudomonas savastanoi pv. fraxini]|nr:hypothetical protein ALP82_03275 [Pseudomonas savastanoi pv. fraxini]